MRVYLVAQAWFSQLVRHENILGSEGDMRMYLAPPHTLTRFPGGADDMRLYMAGAIGGNLKPMWSRTAQRLGAGENFEQATASEVKRYAGTQDVAQEWNDATQKYRPYILESFYYIDADTERLLPYFGDFLLDSGAFTFMMNSKTHVDWNEYLERYAAFINRNRVDKFFELDIDSVVGYDKVLELRRRLERMTNRRPIPVWHINRGKDDYLRMCDEFDYVSVGSNSQNDKYLAWFIDEAHKRGAKIHGLGYTKLNGLKKFHFDSVDSTSWTTGNRFGFVYKFNGRTMVKVDVPKGHRIADPRKVALINYTEWVKFQRWADTHL